MYEIVHFTFTILTLYKIFSKKTIGNFTLFFSNFIKINKYWAR